jgi:putative transposase
MAATAELAPEVGVAPVCHALGLARASVYRRISPPAPRPRRERPIPARALTLVERQAVLDTLHDQRFCDRSPVEVHASLLDESRYLCSPRTMYRILADCVYYYLYVLLDLFSRYAVGWLLADHESASLATRLIAETCAKQNIREGELTIHADRGPAMISKTLAEKLCDLGVEKSHSRPHVSNDNPFSESQFKTLKYWPDFPDRFDGQGHAHGLLRRFFPWYNHEHHHSALCFLTPAVVHHGRAEQVLAERHHVQMAAYLKHPERFVNGPPRLQILPAAVYINPPEKTAHQDAPGSTQRTEDDPEVVPILTTYAPTRRPRALITPLESGLPSH